MKLENKIKKYIKLAKIAKNTNNIVNLSWYNSKLNECKKEIIEILCQHNDFFTIYYNDDMTKTIGNLNTQEFIKNYFETYSIKKIYCGLDKNFGTQITNIDFDI